MTEWAERTARVTFILGGAKSGKSSFALERAGSLPGRKAYIATAEPLDEEMKEKIERHKLDRGKEWDTFEIPLRLADRVREISENYRIVIIDCLTLWLSNIMLSGSDVEKEIEMLVSSLRSSACSLFLVSNEVGMGIVPDNHLSRRFRDAAGSLNRKLAGIADEAYLVTAGLPVKIKP